MRWSHLHHLPSPWQPLATIHGPRRQPRHHHSSTIFQPWATMEACFAHHHHHFPSPQRTSDTTTQTPEKRARTTTTNLHQFVSTIADARQLHLLCSRARFTFHHPATIPATFAHQYGHRRPATKTFNQQVHAPADSREREPYLEIANQRCITTDPPLQQRMHHLRRKTPPHHHVGATTTSEQPHRHTQPREEEECESETLILERYSLRHVSCSYWTVKLVNWSKPAVNSGQNYKNG